MEYFYFMLLVKALKEKMHRIYDNATLSISTQSVCPIVLLPLRKEYKGLQAENASHQLLKLFPYLYEHLVCVSKR